MFEWIATSLFILFIAWMMYINVYIQYRKSAHPVKKFWVCKECGHFRREPGGLSSIEDTFGSEFCPQCHNHLKFRNLTLIEARRICPSKALDPFCGKPWRYEYIAKERVPGKEIYIDVPMDELIERRVKEWSEHPANPRKSND